MGIIHSHVDMGVFFSGTDTTTLNEYAKLSNFCISVIVNNKGLIIAKVAYPINRIIKSSGQQYKDADGNWVTISDQETEQEITSVKSIDMDIVLEMDEFFNNRVTAITSPKPTKFSKEDTFTTNWYGKAYDYDTRQTNLFDTPKYSSSVKAKHTRDQVNNFICKCALLDEKTELIDVKGAIEKMDSKLANINTTMYGNMITDNIEGYYQTATDNVYIIGSEVGEFLEDVMEELMESPLAGKSETLDIIYSAVVDYYSDYLPHYH